MSEREHVPLSFRFNQGIGLRSNQFFIWLGGDLNGCLEAKVTLAKLEDDLSRKQLSIIIVDSEDVRVTPNGATDWINFVAGFLNVQFIYLPSDLSFVLDYDQRYARHTNHVIIDENHIPSFPKQ